jgi:hypothetical protein
METERVVVLSFSRVARDRRVQRQCAALADRGELALVLGYADDQDTIPYPFKHRPSPTPSLSPVFAYPTDSNCQPRLRITGLEPAGHAYERIYFLW